VKSLYIKELDKSFVLLNKSGSLLLLNTLMDFCKYKNYNVTEGVNINSEVFIFVRNPIERLKTNFTWFLGYQDLCLNFFNEYDPKTMITLDNFKKFVDGQDEIHKLNNSHFLPQKCDIMDKNQKFNLTNEIIKSIYPIYNFVQIEKFTDLVIDSISFENDDLLSNYGNKKTNHKPTIDYFLLDLLNADDLVLFSALFLYNKKVLDSRHHTNRSIDLPKKLESKLYILLQDEYDLYGYEKKSHFKQLL